MSSTPTLIRVQKRLQSVLGEDIADALHPRSTALTQYRAVIAARKQLAEVERMLADVEQGLNTPAVEEWERMSGTKIVSWPVPAPSEHEEEQEPEDDINF